jgi:asparagine synthase (glutamine-hydrolysing)
VSLLAAIVDWQNPTPPVETLGRLLSALPERTPDGRRFARAPHVLLGAGVRVVRALERSPNNPYHDGRRSILVAGDVRLDNRDDLKAALSAADRALDSDLAITVAAYERWGPDAVARMVGDFAFVLWDGRRRELFAARDPFGVRSLVYRRSGHQFMLATEPAQFLALPDFDRSPDPQMVVDLLSWSYAHYGPTFFSAARALRPGYYLSANAGSIREIEYFRPPDPSNGHVRSEDYRDEFRFLFRRAVSDRLDSQFPIVAHLSGGLDSSSIVGTAGAIYRDGGARPALHLVSATFPGQPHDETSWIEQVARSLPFEAHRWDGNQPSLREFTNPPLSIPGSSALFNGGSTGDVEIAERLGARVVLSGDPGDSVTGEHGLFNDLLRRGRWLALLRQIAFAGSSDERRLRLTLLKYALREESPRSLLRIWRALHWRRRPVAAPNWLRHAWTSGFIGPEFRSAPRLGIGANRLQQRIWDHLRWTRLAWSTDLMGTYAAGAGLEVRYPLLDLRLVRFVLSVPVEHRMLGSVRRTLHREAATGAVPDAIAWRATKPGFGRAVVQWGHRCRSVIRQILEEPQWHSERFVDRDRVRSAFETLLQRPADGAAFESWLGIRTVVNLETWLRAVFRYPRTKEILRMSETKPAREPESEGAGEHVGEVSRESYVSPTLTPVGNVRDLLAGNPGSQVDSLDSTIGLG